MQIITHDRKHTIHRFRKQFGSDHSYKQNDIKILHSHPKQTKGSKTISIRSLIQKSSINILNKKYNILPIINKTRT